MMQLHKVPAYSMHKVQFRELIEISINRKPKSVCGTEGLLS